MNLNDLPNAAIGVLILVMVVAMFAMIIPEMQTASYTATTMNKTFDNETTLRIDGGLNWLRVYNGTERDFQIPTSDYDWHVANTTLHLKNNTAQGYLEGDEVAVWNIDMHNNATQVYDAGLSAAVQFGNWFVIIIVVIVSVVLLGLIYLFRNNQPGRA